MSSKGRDGVDRQEPPLSAEEVREFSQIPVAEGSTPQQRRVAGILASMIEQRLHGLIDESSKGGERARRAAADGLLGLLGAEDLTFRGTEATHPGLQGVALGYQTSSAVTFTNESGARVSVTALRAPGPVNVTVEGGPQVNYQNDPVIRAAAAVVWAATGYTVTGIHPDGRPIETIPQLPPSAPFAVTYSNGPAAPGAAAA